MRSKSELLTIVRGHLKKARVNHKLNALYINDPIDNDIWWVHSICQLVNLLETIDIITNQEYLTLKRLLKDNTPKNTKAAIRHRKLHKSYADEIPFYWWRTKYTTTAKKAKRPRIKYLDRLIKKYE